MNELKPNASKKMKPTNYHGPEHERIKRQRYRAIVNRKYRMDLYWLCLFTGMLCMGIFFTTVYGPIVLDQGNQIHISLFVIAGCTVAILTLKALERKLF